MRRSVELYVYNSASEDVRVVSIVPNNEWGGNGTLGCDIGYPFLQFSHTLRKFVGTRHGVLISFTLLDMDISTEFRFARNPPN